MRQGIFFIFASTFCTQLTLAQDISDSVNDSPQVEKSKKLNAQIYEKDPNEDSKSLTLKVHLIRELGDIEVFFEGKDKGPYQLKEGPQLGLYKERLIKSQKSKNTLVQVKIEKDFITHVELVESKEKRDEKKDLDSVLDSVFKK